MACNINSKWIMGVNAKLQNFKKNIKHGKKGLGCRAGRVVLESQEKNAAEGER